MGDASKRQVKEGQPTPSLQWDPKGAPVSVGLGKQLGVKSTHDAYEKNTWKCGELNPFPPHKLILV